VHSQEWTAGRAIGLSERKFLEHRTERGLLRHIVPTGRQAPGHCLAWLSLIREEAGGVRQESPFLPSIAVVLLTV
jgi:hypothetical protein